MSLCERLKSGRDPRARRQCCTTPVLAQSAQFGAYQWTNAVGLCDDVSRLEKLRRRPDVSEEESSAELKERVVLLDDRAPVVAFVELLCP